MDGTGLGSCPVAGSGNSGVEPYQGVSEVGLAP
jgi:hypothetical protein